MASPTPPAPGTPTPTYEPGKWPEPLLANASVLSSSEVSLAKLLLKLGQGHLFAEWEPAGTSDEEKHGFFAQIQSMHEAYPGGIEGYVENARRLLAQSGACANPLEGWVPSVPAADSGVELTPGDAEFERYEALGLEAAVHLAFAVPAGGLGERLGYSGVKFALPSEISSGASVLQVYAAHVAALQALLTARLGRDVRLPLLVMTSDDTHEKIGALLRQHGYYGLSASQVTLLRQNKVAALSDPQASFAPDGPYRVQTKPHGHGDIHALLHASGIAARWAREGRRWLFLFQDSSTLYFSTYLASLGVAAARGLDLQFVTMPRRAKMALGVLARMQPAAPEPVSAFSSMLGRLVVGAPPDPDDTALPQPRPLIPVEYNQLEPMLANTGGGSDVNGPGGYSAYPGNTNGIIVSLSTYVQCLEASGGAVREFVNPKYADEARTTFKAPTRLECMMQDYAWLLPPTAKVGRAAPRWPAARDPPSPRRGVICATLAAYHPFPCRPLTGGLRRLPARLRLLPVQERPAHRGAARLTGRAAVRRLHLRDGRLRRARRRAPRARRARGARTRARLPRRARAARPRGRPRARLLPLPQPAPAQAAAPGPDRHLGALDAPRRRHRRLHRATRARWRARGARVRRRVAHHPQPARAQRRLAVRPAERRGAQVGLVPRRAAHPRVHAAQERRPHDRGRAARRVGGGGRRAAH